jgi:hypothetical protein
MVPAAYNCETNQQLTTANGIACGIAMQTRPSAWLADVRCFDTDTSGPLWYDCRLGGVELPEAPGGIAGLVCRAGASCRDTIAWLSALDVAKMPFFGYT